jgi:hypothetical protein
MEKMVSRRIRFTSPEERLIPVGRGFIKLRPGWSGPVKGEVADFAIAKGWAVEVFRDGEPAAYDTTPETTPALEVFTPEPADDEALADFAPEPPRETFEGSE